MLLQKKLVYMVLGGILALGLVFGAAATFAQTDEDEAEPAESLSQEEGDEETLPPFGSRDRRGFGNRGPALGDKDEALAEALDITVEELQAAREEVHEARIAEAVAEGLLTQEQADAILENGASLHRGRGFPGGFMGGDQGEALADALDISVEELEAARDEVHAAALADAVEAGILTQEQADMIDARRAVKDYMDVDGLQAAAQAAYEAAVEEALADGVIDQEQADALLSDAGPGLGGFGGFGPNHGFGHGGRGHRGGGPRFPGGAGFGPSQGGPNAFGTGLGA